MQRLSLNIIKQLCCLVMFFTSIVNYSVAQTNLVRNGSFEQYTKCPSNNTNYDAMPTFWYQPTIIFPLYNNSCSPIDSARNVPYSYMQGINYQPARTGNAHIVIDYFNGLNGRTYIQSQLKDSLKPNHCYYVEFYVNLPNTLKFACNNNGLLFSKMPVYVDTLSYSWGSLAMQPSILGYGNPIITDTVGWQKISSVYVAQGGERFITIGNINTDAQTTLKNVNPTGYHGAGYIIDDVSIYEIDTFKLRADAGADKTISNGDSAFIGSLTNGISNIVWRNATGTIINTQAPGFYVTPSTNTFYTVEQTVCGYTSKDTVYINVLLPLKFISFSIFPFLEGVRGSFSTTNEINVSHYNIQRSINAKDFTSTTTIKANNKNYNEYNFNDQSTKNEKQKTFYYRIESVDNDGKKQYSIIQQINTKHQTPNTIFVYPNPATTIINITSQQKIQQIKIINQLGQTLQQLNNLNTKQQSINIEHFAKGINIIQITTTNQETKTQKIIIK